MWAAIWSNGKSWLVIMTRDELAKKKGFTSTSYMQSLTEGLLPVYDGTRHFQQDNAAIHRSAVTEAFLLQNAISLLEWPSHSPDLNPIEHVWNALKRKVYKMFPHLSGLRRNKANIEEFKECLHKVWVAIDQDFIRALIESVPRRVEACCWARVWYTRY